MKWPDLILHKIYLYWWTWSIQRVNYQYKAHFSIIVDNLINNNIIGIGYISFKYSCKSYDSEDLFMFNYRTGRNNCNIKTITLIGGGKSTTYYLPKYY